MNNSFSINKKNIDNSEKTNNIITTKIYEQNNILNKLDFNVELLNNHFVKCIENYLKSKYMLDISYSEKFISESCKEDLLLYIKKNKNYIKNKDVTINIIKIDLISQNMQSINYVSDLLMNIIVEVFYVKEDIYINFFTEIIEHFSQNIWFKNIDKGWFIEECKPKKILYYNDEKTYYK